jgi:hypothetical protein
MLECHLVGECGKQYLRITTCDIPSLEEEAGRKIFRSLEALGEGLDDGRPPCSRRPTEPKDVLVAIGFGRPCPSHV